MTKIPNPKHLKEVGGRLFQIRFGHWILKIELYLEFGAWNL